MGYLYQRGVAVTVEAFLRGLVCVIILQLTVIQAQVIVINSTECAQWTFWSPWTQISDCFPNCGSGTQTRQRERPCPDSPGVTQFDVQTFACETDPVDGGPGEWSAWTESSDCLAYCGRGLRRAVRSRECNNPAPFCGGKYCKLSDLRDKAYRPCTNFPCGPICPNNHGEYISQYTPAQGYYILCRKTSGFLKPCPYGGDWLDFRSARGRGFNSFYSVCYGNYRIG